MKSLPCFLVTAAASLVCALPTGFAAPSIDQKRQIEVCFVLDTTGSMGGLIEGAKKKIWSIAGTILEDNPGAEIKMGLVGYRDRGDDYVTKVYPLSDDIDTLYSRLMEFQAGGGGDTPESVNQALDEAVRLMGWNKNREVLKTIFLVGDAPPQMGYDEKRYPEICQTAAKNRIFINTVQCGSISETEPIWRSIARSAEGRYTLLQQDGNMTVVAAPQDERLAELNRLAGATLVPYGSRSQRGEVLEKQAAAESAPVASSADRLKYNALSGKAVQGRGDLVRDVADGSVKLDTVKAEELPEDLRGLNETELKDKLAQKNRERETIYAEIRELSAKRDAHIADVRKSQTPGTADQAFDDEVRAALKEQSSEVFTKPSEGTR